MRLGTQSLWRCCLSNPGSHCYINASAMALANLLLTLHDDDGSRWGHLGNGLWDLLRICPNYVLDLPHWRRLLEEWPEIDRQQDVAEFLSFLLEKLPRDEMGTWSARIAMDEATEVVDRGRLVHPLKLVPHSSTSTARWDLQSCVHKWQDEQGPRYAMDKPPRDMIVVQLERFEAVGSGRVIKTSWACKLDNSLGSIHIPYFSRENGLEVSSVPYVISAMILHLGTTVHQGHYTCLLRQNDKWWYKDDAHPTREIEQLTEWHERNVYAIILRKLV